MKMLFYTYKLSKKTHNLLISILFIFFNSCTYDKGHPDYNSYPEKIGKILINSCATAGCHNALSADASAGLDLSSWNSLFKGTRNNSSVIPYRPDHSFLLYSINTFQDLGPELCPTMPLNKNPLKRSEVETIKNWIAEGAPDCNGKIKWSENPDCRKIYVANQGCDYITVFDADSKLIMRSIDVGNENGTEAPHDMLISPDGQFLYVSFYANSIFQKYRTSDGIKVGEINLGTMSWHALAISGNGKYAVCSHFDADGKVALIDLSTMNLVYNYQGSGLFLYPHGCAFNYTGTIAYITCLEGNFLYKMDLTDPSDPDIRKVSLQTGEIPSASGAYKPYEIDFSPDYSKYYVTCQGTNEVRVFKASNDSLLKVIPTTGIPQLVSFSKSRPYAFISCFEDAASTTTQSSINIINTLDDHLISTIDSGYQPRGLAVDDANDCVWIANRNVSGLGVAPHHTTACAGRNGYVTIINMKTLQLIPDWRTEVSVDPYSVVVKE
jgi:DNA-binding beta-propeller fold protein YncE